MAMCLLYTTLRQVYKTSSQLKATCGAPSAGGSRPAGESERSQPPPQRTDVRLPKRPTIYEINTASSKSATVER